MTREEKIEILKYRRGNKRPTDNRFRTRRKPSKKVYNRDKEKRKLRDLEL